MKRILVLNPGSTSTKVALYEDKNQIFVESITHTYEELAPFAKVADQYEFRKNLVLKCLEEKNVDLKTLDAIVARGGLLGALKAGAYEVNEDMIWQLKNKPYQEHASNVGAMIAYPIAQELGIPAYIYDGVTVDEMDEINRYTGFPEFRRRGLGHNLNTRAAAIRYAKENGKSYDDITVIVAHLGGGISVNLHTKGHIADFISDDEGPYSPERSGWLPIVHLVKLCYSGKYTCPELLKRMKNQSGLKAYCGTTDSREVEKMIENGDEKAKIVYEAMALNVAKNIGKCAPYVYGKVDAIILTGGIAYSKYFTDMVKERVEWIAPVVIYPGEDEMKALAEGTLRVLNGEETARTYTRVETSDLDH